MTDFQFKHLTKQCHHNHSLQWIIMTNTPCSKAIKEQLKYSLTPTLFTNRKHQQAWSLTRLHCMLQHVNRRVVPCLIPERAAGSRVLLTDGTLPSQVVTSIHTNNASYHSNSLWESRAKVTEHRTPGGEIIITEKQKQMEHIRVQCNTEEKTMIYL